MRLFLYVVLGLLICPTLLYGKEQTDSISPLSIVFGLSFETNFDNREYRPIAPSPSQTIFGSRIIPSVGILSRSNILSHSVMVGIDAMREFGNSVGVNNGGCGLNAIQLYYQLRGQCGRSVFTMTTGVFPKNYGRKYPLSFLSDSLRFYENNYEGLLMTFSHPNSYYEFGCNWIGMREIDSRERFILFSQGETNIGKCIAFGYYANLFHYAGSIELSGVVDNILLNPWISFKVEKLKPSTKAILQIGWLQAAQNDRRNIGRYTFPNGIQINIGMTCKNFGLNSELYYGQGLMPYYDKTDAGGHKYGSTLYYGDSFYRITQGGRGIYDRAELFYEPSIADFLRLRISMIAHFGKEYFGWQQCFSLIFDMKARA